MAQEDKGEEGEKKHFWEHFWKKKRDFADLPERTLLRIFAIVVLIFLGSLIWSVIS